MFQKTLIEFKKWRVSLVKGYPLEISLALFSYVNTNDVPLETVLSISSSLFV